jgi:23S rRNA (cytosine1962-C5)-methyltransferase
MQASKMNTLELIRAAKLKRYKLESNFEAFRVIDGVGDKISNLYLDKYGQIAFAHVHVDKASDALIKDINSQEVLDALAVKSLYLCKRFTDPKQSASKGVELLLGKKSEQQIIKEHGISYLIDPVRHINAGLFLDTRNLRKMIIENTANKKVLNLFCYTGSLGLSALIGGAKEVTQVDTSKTILSWAKENLALNTKSTSDAGMRFIQDDALAFIEKEQRRISKGASPYDLVIVDPPSFSRSKISNFKVDRDYKKLIESVIPIISVNAKLVVVTNFSAFDSSSLLKLVSNAALKLNRKIVSHQQLFPAEDYTSKISDSIAMRGVVVSF